MGKNTGFVLCTIGALVFVSMVRCQSNRGIPGVDYPNYFSIPETSFSCNKQKYIPGFYADIETQCQAFHFCYQNRQESFLCPTGTIFNQEILACDPWYNFNCSFAPSFFSKNAGPAMAKAGRNIPMLLKLRSTQGRSKVQTPKKVYDKVEKPYETRIKSEETLRDSRESESLGKGPTNEEVALQEETLMNSRLKEDGELDILSDIEENEVKDVEESPDYSAENENVEDIVYDPVTDGYYTKYNRYEPGWQPEYEPVSDEFSSFYEYANQPLENEEMVKESIDEFRDEDSEILHQSSDALDLNKVTGVIDETTDFSKRYMNADPQTKRTRRKPLYFVVPDEEDEPNIKLPGRPRRNLQDSTSTMEQSSGANDTSEEQSEQDRNEPFPRPTAIPSHLLNHTTQVPMTSGQFEAAILTELVIPEISDDELGSDRYPIIGSTQIEEERQRRLAQERLEQERLEQERLAQNQTNDGSPAQQTEGSAQNQTDDGSPAQQTEGSAQNQTDDGSPAQQTDMQSDQPSDDTYGFEYARYGDDAQRGAYANLHSDPSYRIPTGTSEDVDETFVVIPDELDMPSTVETAPTGASDPRIPISQMYADDYSQYRSSFESPEAYGSYQFRPPPVHGFGNYPEGWRRDYQHYLSNVRDRYYQNQHGFQMNQPAGYEHPYSGPESPYFYDDVYPGSHPQSGGANYESGYSNDYADPKSAVWVTDSSEAGELSDVVVATQSPTLDITEASRIDLESSSIADLGTLSDDTANVFSAGGMSQDDEKYYVFDFDEEELEAEKDNSEMLKEPDFTKSDGESVKSGFSELPDLKESYETDQLESLQVLDSNDKLNVDSSKSESTEEISLDSDYSTSEHKNIEYPSEFGIEEENTSDDTKSLTTESSRASEEPVTLSTAFERLAALKKKPQSPSLQSYDFSKDPSLLNNAVFPESMDFGPYGYGSSMGQKYGMLDSTNTKTGNKFVHRTGESEQSQLSKLSAIQDRIRSVKQGKFGMFKKYMGSTKNL